jgi:hypothetical protein
MSLQRAIEQGEDMWWRELRSLTEHVRHRPEHIDHLMYVLLAWPDTMQRERALHYAMSKLGRLMLGRHDLSLGDVLAWCFEGYPALKVHLSRFHDVLDHGVELWVSLLAWACVLTQLQDVMMDVVQITTSFEVEGHESMRKLYLMSSHDLSSYVLDVHQGSQRLCMGIVNKTRWEGFDTAMFGGLADVLDV